MKAFIISTPPFNVYEHMAFDEALARSCDKNQEIFYLRFFNWGANTAGDALTFGYAQFFNQIEQEMKLNNFNGPFTRRPTGGGVVYHKQDLTFSCVFSSELTRPKIIYNKLHGAINRCLSTNKASAMFDESAFDKNAYAPEQGGRAGACFATPVPDDIMDDKGNKILGGAIRRFDNIVLYQGSLQAQNCRGGAEFESAIKNAVEQEWGLEFEPFSFSEHHINNIKQVANLQYKSDNWIKKF
ncbi:lipoate-protein ligase A [Elusimicrobium posterum]|uniref:lipoyl protein ligase domain-containing protein n=1 Tax=Elusimicrobium posterum TaxID=3116653 RepID=UPI003C743056